MELAESVGDHELLAILVDVAAQQQDLHAIQRYAPRAEELALRYGHVLYQGVVARAWGVAHRLVGEHSDLFEQLGTRWQLGRTLAEQGHLALARGEPGRKHFARALELFEAMGAAPDAARTREILQDAE